MAGNNEAGPSGTANDNNSSGKYYFCQMHPLFPWIPSSSGSGTIVVIFKCSNMVVIACLEFNMIFVFVQWQLWLEWMKQVLRTLQKIFS